MPATSLCCDPGYTGTRYLAAASVSDLWTQSTGVFIMGGVLSMFCSQAIGAGNHALAGIWMQVPPPPPHHLLLLGLPPLLRG